MKKINWKRILKIVGITLLGCTLLAIGFIIGFNGGFEEGYRTAAFECIMYLQSLGMTI